MRSIMLAFASPEAASKVKNVLICAGLPVRQVCSSGASLLQQAMLIDAGGVVILPTRLPDMSIPDLLSRLPDTFDLLVLQSGGQRADFDQLPGLTKLEMPLPSAMLVETVVNLLETRTATGTSRKHGAGMTAPHAQVHKRTMAEEQILRDAKQRLIDERQLTEDQAHRYLQRRSMETGTRLLDIAQRVLEQGLA